MQKNKQGAIHSVTHKNKILNKLQDPASNSENRILRLAWADIVWIEDTFHCHSKEKENTLKNIMTAVYPNTQTH